MKKSGVPRQFPADQQIVKLRYAESIQLDAGIGSVSSYNFRANSLFDPNETGIGHQPLGFDQWAEFYNRYTVLGSRCTVIFNTDTNQTGVNQLCSLQLSRESSPGLNATTAIEDPNVATRVVNGVYNGKAGIVTLRKNYSAKKWFNVKDPMVLDHQTCNFDQNPTENVRYIVSSWAMDGADPPNLHCTVIIDYIVKFSAPQRLLQS